ncbi:MAG: sulfate reduction electron transfer complex DsrMKJOP subunit DsrJ [Chloroflexota bacterium]
MYDSKYVVAGLSLFVGVFLGFSIFAIGTGSTNKLPQPVLPKDETQCVESTEFMRANHMQMLVEWREEVVRNNDRVYVSRLSGKQFEKSLTNTCMSCHENKQEFCDTCHSSAGVSPNCWDCHNVPEEQHL